MFPGRRSGSQAAEKKSTGNWGRWGFEFQVGAHAPDEIALYLGKRKELQTRVAVRVAPTDFDFGLEFPSLPLKTQQTLAAGGRQTGAAHAAALGAHGRESNRMGVCGGGHADLSGAVKLVSWNLATLSHAHSVYTAAMGKASLDGKRSSGLDS